MRLSTRSTYGMRALVELALGAGRGPISATAIAKRQDLSAAYLEQLLHRLKRQGLVNSIRGPRGGYVLARDPRRITMADVVSVLDGGNGLGNGGAKHLSVSSTVRAPTRQSRESGRVGAKGAQRQAQWIVQAVRRCVHERITESLGAVTLQDLCDEVRTIAGEPLGHRHVFHI